MHVKKEKHLFDFVQRRPGKLREKEEEEEEGDSSFSPSLPGRR
jgi:hypothetical protein